MSGYNTDESSDNNNKKITILLLLLVTTATATVSNLFSCSGVLPWGTLFLYKQSKV